MCVCLYVVVFRVVKKFINQLEEALDLPEK